MIGDTLGYDRCCHVSTANDGLWVSDSRFGVHPVSGSPGDDLLDGRGEILEYKGGFNFIKQLFGRPMLVPFPGGQGLLTHSNSVSFFCESL
jgi:hypothetical protein